MKNLFQKLSYLLRNLLTKKMFDLIDKNINGSILDVGGWDFFLKLKDRPIQIKEYTCLENSTEHAPNIQDPKFKLVIGDGCAMGFRDEQFDSLLNIQVVEHVFEPILMVKECARVLKKGGKAVFLIPQTASLHLIPYHYYNFTIFWIEKVMEESGFKILEIYPIGGGWRSIAYRKFHYIYLVFGLKKASMLPMKRNFFYYILLPFAVLFTIILIPIALFFSLADYNEETTNHLLLVEKK